MYESPIKVLSTEVIDDICAKINKDFSEYVLKEIAKCAIVVSEDELIKALAYDRDQYRKGYKDGYKDGKAEQGWIPLKDGYPKDGTYCLVTIECSYGKSVIMAGFSENFRKWDFSGEVERRAFYRNDPVWGCIEVGGVVAWKPLPKPYERREKER